MNPEQVESLQRQYVDQYVVVDAQRAGLPRFKDTVGRVRMVNMNGRALVEFDAEANRSWYDIDPALLTIVDKPAPKVVEKKAAPAAKAKPEAKPAEGTAAQA